MELLHCDLSEYDSAGMKHERNWDHIRKQIQSFKCEDELLEACPIWAETAS